jgi:hypothetical protein
MTTDAMTPQHVVDLFGDKVRKHANLISAIYGMHYTFALKQTTFAKPELLVEELEHTQEYTVTVRGGLGVDTRALTSTKLQEVKFDAKCRSLQLDIKGRTTEYTISDKAGKAAYDRRTPSDTNAVPFVDVKQNHSSKAIALTKRLSDRRLRRVINLYTQSAEQVPEFDVFLEAQTNKSYLLMTINNVKHVSVKFMFELLRDPIANVCRVQVLLDQTTADLQIWFECAHDDSSKLLGTKPRRSRFFQNPY